MKLQQREDRLATSFNTGNGMEGAARRRPLKAGHRRRSTETGKARDEFFALAYLANGYNATAAYKSAHPRCAQRTAEVNGSRLLRKAEVSAFIEREEFERRQRLRMEADEALEGLSRIARADIRRLYDCDGHLLPIALWPLDIADCVKTVTATRYGPAVTLHDKLKAFELIAIAGGLLKRTPPAEPEFDHAAFLGIEPPAGESG